MEVCRDCFYFFCEEYSCTGFGQCRFKGLETIWSPWKKQRLHATVFLSLHRELSFAKCSSQCVPRQIPCNVALLPSTRKGWGFAHASSHCGNALCWSSLHSRGMERHIAFASFVIHFDSFCNLCIFICKVSSTPHSHEWVQECHVVYWCSTECPFWSFCCFSSMYASLHHD